MFFLNFGNGYPGGVGTYTNYKTANEDGAWVGMERYVHPTDAQYSWVNRLAELYSARTKTSVGTVLPQTEYYKKLEKILIYITLINVISNLDPSPAL